MIEIILSKRQAVDSDTKNIIQELQNNYKKIIKRLNMTFST